MLPSTLPIPLHYDGSQTSQPTAPSPAPAQVSLPLIPVQSCFGASQYQQNQSQNCNSARRPSQHCPPHPTPDLQHLKHKKTVPRTSGTVTPSSHTDTSKEGIAWRQWPLCTQLTHVQSHRHAHTPHMHMYTLTHLHLCTHTSHSSKCLPAYPTGMHAHTCTYMPSYTVHTLTMHTSIHPHMHTLAVHTPHIHVNTHLCTHALTPMHTLMYVCTHSHAHPRTLGSKSRPRQRVISSSQGQRLTLRDRGHLPLISNSSLTRWQPRNKVAS